MDTLAERYQCDICVVKLIVELDLDRRGETTA